MSQQPSKDEPSGCGGCIFGAGIASGILLYAVLPWFGVEVPTWVKVADFVVLGLAGLFFVVIPELLKLADPPKKPGGDAEKKAENGQPGG